MSRANIPNGTRNGKRRSVYLDDATVEAARALGDGNIGEGIRRVLASVTRAALALKPFAEVAEYDVDPVDHDDASWIMEPALMNREIKVGDLRRASRTFSEIKALTPDAFL